MPFDGYNERSVVVLDNASIHHIDPVVQAINSVGALVKFLPPYSPDLMPLEEVFAEVKGFIRQNHTLFSCPQLPARVLISHAFTQVSVENCILYIHHAGYV